MRTAMTRIRGRHGLTLVETIVVMAVFGLLTLTITQLMTGGLRAWKKGQVRNQLRSDARYAMDQIQADFRQNTTLGLGAIIPSTSATKSSTLQFTRTKTDGTTTETITYTINANRTLTRQDNSGTTVIAENVVDTDPRDGAQKSYFAWEDANLTTMGIHLYLVQDAATQLSASSPQSLESIYLHSSAYWNAEKANTAYSTTVWPQVGVSTPSSLIDPRHLFLMTSAGRDGGLK
jgi:prepilin-type N-terminal cleavage/methylation domain-containing protein